MSWRENWQDGRWTTYLVVHCNGDVEREDGVSVLLAGVDGQVAVVVVSQSQIKYPWRVEQDMPCNEQRRVIAW